MIRVGDRVCISQEFIKEYKRYGYHRYLRGVVVAYSPAIFRYWVRWDGCDFDMPVGPGVLAISQWDESPEARAAAVDTAKNMALARNLPATLESFHI